MAGRNRTPISGSNLRHNHHRLEESVSRHPRRVLTLTEVRMLDDRIAAQSREIEAILLDNQRLATSHVALKREVADAQEEIRRLSVIASTVNAETDAQVREVYERSLKLEADARSFDGLSTELDRLRAGIKQHRDERTELLAKLKDIEGQASRSQTELQEFAELKTEIEAWEKEIRKGRAAIECERKMSSNNFKLNEAMEKHKNTLAAEAEKLRSELANAERRAIPAVVEPVSSANQGPIYAVHQPGYGGSSFSDPHVVHQADPILSANQGPVYAIHQPGYGGNSLSDPHVVHQSDPILFANQGPVYAIHQPRYGGNSLSDPHLVHAVSVGNQGTGYAIHQPALGGNSLSDPNVVHQVPLSVANQGPGYAIDQPEYNRNPLSDPHVVHQGKSPNKKQKWRPNKKGKLQPNKLGKSETDTQEKKPKCPKCKKKHIGECLSGKKVCFKCKEPGHIAVDCPLNKGEKVEKEGKGQGFTST